MSDASTSWLYSAALLCVLPSFFVAADLMARRQCAPPSSETPQTGPASSRRDPRAHTCRETQTIGAVFFERSQLRLRGAAGERRPRPGGLSRNPPPTLESLWRDCEVDVGPRGLALELRSRAALLGGA